MSSCLPLCCQAWCYSPRASTPTKKAVALAITLVALGAIAAFIGTMSLLASTHHLPKPLLFFNSLSSLTVRGGISLCVGGGIVLATGVILSIALTCCKKRSSTFHGSQVPSTQMKKPLPRQHSIYSCAREHLTVWRLFLKDNEYIIMQLTDDPTKLVLLTKGKIPYETTYEFIQDELNAIQLNEVSYQQLIERNKAPDVKEAAELAKKLNPGEYFFHPPTSSFLIREPAQTLRGNQPNSTWPLPAPTDDDYRSYLFQLSSSFPNGRCYIQASIDTLRSRENPLLESLETITQDAYRSMHKLLTTNEYAAYRVTEERAVVITPEGPSLLSFAEASIKINSLSACSLISSEELALRLSEKMEQVSNLPALQAKLKNGECFFHPSTQMFYGRKSETTRDQRDVGAFWFWATPRSSESDHASTLNEQKYTVLSTSDLEQRT